MLFEQEQRPFREIKITLSTSVEAEGLMTLMDKVLHLSSPGIDRIRIDDKQRNVAVLISNAFTNGVISI